MSGCKSANLHPQVGHSLSGNVLAHAQNLDSNLWHLLELANFSNIGDRSGSRPELASAGGGPARFGVLAGTGIATCAGLEDGRFAGREAGVGHVKDEHEALQGLRSGCHWTG